MVPLDDSLRFNSILVLESLRPGDLPSATDLIEQVLYPAAATDPAGGFNISHSFAPDRSGLARALSTLEHRVRQFNHLPILHLEAHGRERAGLVLTDGSLVTWAELAERLAVINRLTRFNFMVTVSACWGADLVSTLYPSRPAPFWGMIGPTGEIGAGVLLDAWRAFYEGMLLRGDARAGIADMRAVDRRMSFFPAEHIFRLVYFKYVHEKCQGVELETRVEDVLKAILAARPEAAQHEHEIRELLRSDVSDHELHFARLKEIYFMCDEIPENRARFRSKFSDGPPREFEELLRSRTDE